MIADISMGRQGMEITVGLKRAPQRDFFVVFFVWALESCTNKWVVWGFNRCKSDLLSCRFPQQNNKLFYTWHFIQSEGRKGAFIIPFVPPVIPAGPERTIMMQFCLTPCKQFSTKSWLILLLVWTHIFSWFLSLSATVTMNLRCFWPYTYIYQISMGIFH